MVLFSVVAKQEAFEESIRLKNQFRALDEDEVEFLDSLLESTRAQEAAVKKETAENLAEYQRQREEAERALIEGTSGGQHSSTSGVNLPGEEEQWVVAGKKRKRNKKEAFVPPKIRKSSSATEDAPAPAGQKPLSKTAASSEEGTNRAKIKPDPAHSSSASAPAKIVSMETNNKSSDVKSTKNEPQHKATPKASLGLVAYGSDEDSD